MTLLGRGPEGTSNSPGFTFLFSAPQPWSMAGPVCREEGGSPRGAALGKGARLTKKWGEETPEARKEKIRQQMGDKSAMTPQFTFLRWGAGN